MGFDASALPTARPVDPGWVDSVLLAGPGAQTCLHLGRPISRDELRGAVTQRQDALRRAGLRAGGSLLLRLPPSLSFIANLLAGWRLGAQVTLLDHRLTEHEAQLAYQRLRPQLVLVPATPVNAALRAFHEVTEVPQTHPGQPAETGHALIQLSSGSTGPSKVIGRTAADLIAEINRYTLIDGVPRAGERVVLLASMVHVLGLVGGLLYGLHTGVELVAPARMTVPGILVAVAAGAAPTTVLGVPFHVELLASVATPPPLPQLAGMTTGGELVRPELWQAFTDRYRTRLGNMYGMTEVGVIATDLFGTHRPAVRPAPGIEVRAVHGELQVALPASPYVGPVEPGRWVDGWLRTKDAGTVAADTGLVRVLGRSDSQISVGGLKVDLTEVEHTLAGLPGVGAAVVVHRGVIEAYVVLTDPPAISDPVSAGDPVVAGDVVWARVLADALAQRLAGYKRPRVIHIVDQLPRTATGKVVRDHAALRAAARVGELDPAG